VTGPRPGEHDAFRRLVGSPGDDIDLVRACLEISGTDQGKSIDPNPYLDALDSFAESCRSAADSATDPLSMVEALNDVLFYRHGFLGNSTEYYDPRNSYLDEVIDRRTGIPITLSIVYMEVARRIGLHLDGVALPGHFVTRLDVLGRELFIDPFHCGVLLDAVDAEAVARTYVGEEASLPPEVFQPVGPRAILERMLRNLRVIYLQQERFDLALSATERILLLDPDQPEEIRDRGLLYYHLDHHYLALRDLTHFLRVEPLASDRAGLSDLVRTLKKLVQSHDG
jgi:regulator of sirC expression with transglutaminase-like and TPR domain